MDDAALVVAAASVNELRLRALRGELSTILLASIDRLKHAVVPSSKLAVFASSTFTDTVRERNLMLEKIQPDLRERGRAPMCFLLICAGGMQTNARSITRRGSPAGVNSCVDATSLGASSFTSGFSLR